VRDVGVWEQNDIPSTAPSWARLFTAIGREMAELPNRRVGETSPVLVASVPTGQYAAWLIAAGALGAPAKLETTDEPGDYRATTWDEGRGQVGDVQISIAKQIIDGEQRIVVKIGQTTYTKGLPYALQDADPPSERAGQLNLSKVEKLRIASAIKPLLPRNNQWYLWWAQQCASPVMLVGTGSEYWMNQRSELLDSEPSWIWPTSRTLLGLDMARLCDPARALLFPFSIISPSVGGRFPWLRSIRPRLVIYTSWKSFSLRHPAAFAGVPTVVLANRRVESALKCATDTESIRRPDISDLQCTKLRIRGIDLRIVDYPVIPDDGSISDDEETPDDF